LASDGRWYAPELHPDALGAGGPLVEAPVVEDTVVEDTVVEDTVVEDTVVQEPVVEQPVVQDTGPPTDPGPFAVADAQVEPSATVAPSPEATAPADSDVPPVIPVVAEAVRQPRHLPWRRRRRAAPEEAEEAEETGEAGKATGAAEGTEEVAAAADGRATAEPAESILEVPVIAPAEELVVPSAEPVEEQFAPMSDTPVATEEPPDESAAPVYETPVATEEAPEEAGAPVPEPSVEAAEGSEDEVAPPVAEALAPPDALVPEPSRRARRKLRRRRTALVAAAVVVIAGAVAAAITLSGSTSPTATPPHRATTTLPAPPATGWTASDIRVVGGPIVAGNRILVVDASPDGAMNLAAVDPHTGKVAWQQPFSASSVPPGVLITPVAIGTTALDLAPATGPTDPSVVLKGIDVNTGQPAWTSPAPAVVVDAPVTCASQSRFCVNVSGTGGTTQLEQVDPAKGAVTATLAGPHTQMASNLYQTGAQPPGFVAVSDAGALLWSKSVAALFGGAQFSPQYGYDFVTAGPLDVGTVGVAPSAGGSLPLGSFETIGITATSGAVAWMAPGALDCFGVVPVTPQFLCRYSGSGTYVNGNLSTAGVTLTLGGLNPATGAVTWSVPVAQAQSLTTGNGLPVADANHLVVALASGPALLDLGSGQTAPVPAGAVYWCGQSQQASVQATPSALSGGRRVGATLFAPCTAEGAPATGMPTSALPAIGVSIGGLFVWPSPNGLMASATPR
jgi:hypothetical protein